MPRVAASELIVKSLKKSTADKLKLKLKKEKTNKTKTIVKSKKDEKSVKSEKKVIVDKKIKKSSKATDLQSGKVVARKPHRFRPGTVARREVRKYQMSNSFMIPKLPFARLVRELTHKVAPGNTYRFQKSALISIQEAVEMYLVKMLGVAGVLSKHANNVSVKGDDLKIVKRIDQLL